MKYILLLSAFFLCGSASSRSLELIVSCDGSSKISYQGNYVINFISGKKTSRIMLSHELNGGSIDPVTSMFVVYGVPKKLIRINPQLMTLSIYKNFRRPTLIQKENLGGGIYSAEFSQDHRFIVVNTRFGGLIVDIKRNKTIMLPLDEPANIDVLNCQK